MSRIAPLLALLLASCFFAGCNREPAAPDGSASGPAASYVGAASCLECHAKQANLWKGSDHAHAMQPANERTVLGDFRGATFRKDGVITTFTTRDGAYYVTTDGPDGALHEYEVGWTFGLDPLQQYLIAFPDGRLQALDTAWDARPAAAGGQRWYALHPDERVDFHDVLHWTGPALNWNHMCADCHSTDLRKNHDAARGRFATKWSDLEVACEACHGPGSAHVAWAGRAQAGGADASADDGSHGLVVRLARQSEEWEFPPGETIARRRQPLATRAELEVCGRCHARRAQIWDEITPGEPLGQAFRVALLDPGLYDADGRIHDEVYEYGSFLQSRMHAEGVTCSNCHEPHSARLRVEGNLVCAQCHLHAKYDGAQHHFHQEGTAAAQCVACHMPMRTYMGVDGRRDHAFRVPRPDLSVQLGTADACTGCHQERGATWAADAVTRWYGTQRKVTGWHWAEAIHAGRTARSDAETQLSRALTEPKVAGIVRATALELLMPYLSPRSIGLIAAAARDADPLVRRAAAATLVALDPQERVGLGFELLRDPIRDVRIEAVGSLLDLPRNRLDARQLGQLDAAIAEYRRSQAVNGDRAEANANLGALEAALGNLAAAEAALRSAIRLQPQFVPARVQLADLLGRNGREAEGERLLRETLALVPEGADAHHALGLSLARQKRMDEALVELAHAAALAPDDARFAYVLAVALHDSGQLAAALPILQQAHRRRPAEREILGVLIQYTMERGEGGDRSAALALARELLELTPWDDGLRELIDQLQKP